MVSSETAGREDAQRVVRAAVAADRLSPTWILVGEQGIGKRAFAEWMVRLRWCTAEHGRPCGACPSCRRVSTGNHPDLVEVRRDPPTDLDPQGLGSRHEITVGQVRELVLGGLSLRAVEGRGRAVIIDGAEDLNVEAQNALLKVLEEPPRGSLLLLVTAHEEVLLDTVRSRCHELRLAPLDASAMERAAGDVDPLLRSLARGRPGRLPDLQRVDAAALLSSFDELLAGRLGGGAFATIAEASVSRGVEQDGDEATLQRLVLDLLHGRLAAHALVAAGGLAEGLESTPLGSDLAPIGLAERWERALMQAQADIRRHLPPSVSWVALGYEIEAARVGA